MKRTFTTFHMLALALAATSQAASFALSEKDLRGPIAPAVSGQAKQAQPTVTTPSAPANNGQMGGLSAPGADALMTPDMLLVTPTASTQQNPVPLGALVGNALKLNVLRSDVTFEKFRGILISVTNGTNRPLVVDGDQATAVLNGHTFKCATVAAIQQSIQAPRKISTEFQELLTLALPAALTVGASPTIRDIRESQRPVLERYGPDELRRKIEFTRFGRRILWTNQKVEGIIYFESDEALKTAQIVIPTTTLFDNKDTSKLTSTSVTAIPLPSTSPTSSPLPSTPSTSTPPSSTP
jgi:hypothetical protein